MEPTNNGTPGIQNATNQDIDLVQTESSTEQKDSPVGVFNFDQRGASGTRIFGEIFDEEYLSKLSGTRRADTYDEMQRSDDIVTMLLTARKNPILQGNWSFEPAKADDGDTAQEELYKRQAEHVEHEFMERMSQDFMEFVEESLTFIDQGYSLFERIHELVDDPKFGKYIGYKKFGWRSQRTIERWDLNKEGKIKTVFQQADGDVGAYVQIPGEWTTVFSLRKTGDNYEGISALRSIYGNWQRKSIFLKLIAIGIERYAINTPVGKIPAGKEQQQAERDRFMQMLKSISSHHQNYFMLPAGWEVDFLKNPFDADKVVAVIRREDEGMVKSFMANHLNLGQGGGSGSYALGTDLSDQFLSIIENDAAIICRRFNKEIIREFITFNYGKQAKYPKLKVTGINDKFSKEFAEIIKMLIDGKALTATENLERWLRKRLDVPELLQADAAIIPDVRKTDAPAPMFNEQLKGVTFADIKKTKAKVKDQIDSSAELVAQAMKDELQSRTDDFTTKLINAMKKEKRDNWRKVIRNSGELSQEGDFVRKLKRALIETAGRALSQARNEVPGGRKVEFMDGIRSRIKLDEVDDLFASLPKKIRDLILTDPAIVAGAQFGTLRTKILLVASAAVDETADPAVIEGRIKDEVNKALSGSGASEISGAISTSASNLTAKVYNTTRVEFFQTDEVLDKIEAFQFVNTDPVSPICQDLNGRIFAKDDPESDQYLPPLHHNCKSFIVPIFDLQGKKVSDIGLQPSKASLDKFKTL